MAVKRDFYEVLGVARGAPADELQREYRKLAREVHPDINKDPGAEATFKEIAEAYDVLSDPETRRKYDSFGHDFRQVPDDVDPEMWNRAQSARGRPGAGQAAGGPQGWDDRFSESDLGSIFGDLFGGRDSGPRGWGPIPGADQQAELTLSLEDAFHGEKQTITLSGPGGDRSYEVSIPPGVREGQRIRLSGQGGAGTAGEKPGDLYLEVHIAPHPRFRLEGRDIYVDLRITPWEAALGASVSVDSPAGPGKVQVPAGTPSGKRLRLRGRGMPVKNGTPGDLYAEVRIMVPTSPSDDERHLFEALAEASDFDPRKTA
jgi:curved DNA-binding protein